MQRREAVKEMLTRAIGSFVGGAIADEVLARNVRTRPGGEIGARTEATTDAGQHDDSDLGIIIASAHVFANFGDSTVLLGCTDERVHPLRLIELDPENAVVFRFVEQVFDESW